MKKCINCKKEITKKAKRCKSCSNSKNGLGRKASEKTKKRISNGIKNNLPSTSFKEGEHPWNFKLRGDIRLARGKRNNKWKGDEVSYAGLHIWVKNNLGNPIKCEFCGKIETNRRKINWANKSHEYKRDLNDWFALCGFCHYKYDRGLR